MGFNYFYFFFAFNLISGICYALFYPETKGKTLEQMDQLFGDAKVVHVLEDLKGAVNKHTHNDAGASEHVKVAEKA